MIDTKWDRKADYKYVGSTPSLFLFRQVSTLLPFSGTEADARRFPAPKLKALDGGHRFGNILMDRYPYPNVMKPNSSYEFWGNLSSHLVHLFCIGFEAAATRSLHCKNVEKGVGEF